MVEVFFQFASKWPKWCAQTLHPFSHILIFFAGIRTVGNNRVSSISRSVSCIEVTYVMPRLHQRNKLRATCCLLVVRNLLRATSCAGVNAALHTVGTNRHTHYAMSLIDVAYVISKCLTSYNPNIISDL